MTIRIQKIIKCNPHDGGDTAELRRLFCEVALDEKEKWRLENPLVETKFNSILKRIVQEAFDDGIFYEQGEKS